MMSFWLHLTVVLATVGAIHSQEVDGRLLQDMDKPHALVQELPPSHFLRVDETEQTTLNEGRTQATHLSMLNGNREGLTSSNIVPASLEPENQLESPGMKREEERYEATVLNNPKPKLENRKSQNEKLEQFVKQNAHDIASDLSEKHLEMDEGDITSSKDATDGGLREILKNAAVNNSIEINTAETKTPDKKFTSLKNDNKFLSEFENLIKTNDIEAEHHHLEPGNEPLELTEEEHLNKKLDFLKNKIKERQKLNKLKEEEKLLHDQKLFDLVDVDTTANTIAVALNRKNDSFNIESIEKNYDMPRLTLRNITDVGRVRAPSATPNKAFFAFSYDPASLFGPPSWQLLNTEWTCTARRQSPINIETQYLMDNEIVKNIVVKVHPQNSPLSGVLRNNGHAPTLSLSNDVSVRLFGGTLGNDYYLKQLHFHFGCDSTTGSEHHINGIVYPLELHLVFWDNSTFATFPEAAKADRGIAVIAVLYQLENIPYGESKTSPLSQVEQIIRHIEEEGDNVTVSEEFNFRLEKLIPNIMNPESMDRFYIYEGSLTTPGCYESVTWIVMATHPSVTESQLRIFRSLKSTKVSERDKKMCNNYRPVQKKNGRRIYSNLL